MAHANSFSRMVFQTSPKSGASQVAARQVPALRKEDVIALGHIRSSGEFSLEKSADMYAGVKRQRPSK